MAEASKIESPARLRSEISVAKFCAFDFIKGPETSEQYSAILRRVAIIVIHAQTNCVSDWFIELCAEVGQ